jgi:hypothetical protein
MSTSIEAERQRIVDRIAEISASLLVLYRMRAVLRPSAAQDRARARPAAVVVDRAPDITVEIDMQSAIPGYARLR